MLGKVKKKLEEKRKRLITFVCEAGSWSAGIAGRMIKSGEIKVNGVIEKNTEYLLEHSDSVSGYE